MRKFDNVNELINTLKPDNPVYCIRPKSIKKSVEFFKSNFPGKILYAVKTNPNKFVLKTLYESGIKNFDIASIKEIKTIEFDHKDVIRHPLVSKIIQAYNKKDSDD